jgi:hypothetical protein
MNEVLVCVLLIIITKLSQKPHVLLKETVTWHGGVWHIGDEVGNTTHSKNHINFHNSVFLPHTYMCRHYRSECQPRCTVHVFHYTNTKFMHLLSISINEETGIIQKEQQI